MSSTIGSRLAYQAAKEAINRAGYSVNTAVLSQSYLRLEQSLSTSKTVFNFPILVNDSSTGSATATEVRLNLQDAFCVSSAALYFCVPGSSTAVNFALCSYPNTSVFSASNTATSLYNWYNGYISVTVNNRQIVPAIDLGRFLDVPQTQQAANADYSGSAITVKDQQKGDSTAYCPIEPMWVFSGSKQNQIQVTLPGAMAAVESNSRAVLIFKGHLAQNVSSVR